MAVNRGVAATVNNAMPTGRHFQPVPMAPDSARVRRCIAATKAATLSRREGVKVATQQATTIWITPKINRHRGQGLGTNQLAHVINDHLPLAVPSLNGAAQ